MSRGLIILLLAATAYAEPEKSLADDLGDQGVGVEAGLAAGGRVTPGGLRITGHYLYQLADREWFDGGASFTFGSGGAQCFRDRSNAYVCEHGVAEGEGFEVSATVRHYFDAQGEFLPFVRGGLGLAIVRFPADGVSGFAIPLHVGGGVRYMVSDAVAVTGQGELQIGFGDFGHGVGMQPQLGLGVIAGAEFPLR